MNSTGGRSTETDRQDDSEDSTRWGLFGALMGLGAPVGLWLVLTVTNPAEGAETLSYVYWYTGMSTSFVFSVFGIFVGRMIARLRDVSTHDQLTGLSNRRLLMSHLPGLFANRERQSDTLCVLMLDLDHFKRVNDTHGHAVGDITLAAVARAILEDVRVGDIVARYGGEEFVVVCPHADEESGLTVARRIRESISSLGPEQLGFDGVQTVSIGLMCVNAKGTTPTVALTCADEALYEAKSSGRDRVCVYRGKGLSPVETP